MQRDIKNGDKMSFLINVLVIALTEQAPLILAAVGFTLIFYLNGFINVAYAENITLGAYFAVVFNTIMGLNFYLTIIPAALLSGLVSVITFLLVFRPALKRGVGKAEMIVLSVGLSFFMRYATKLAFGAQLRLFDIAKPSYWMVFGTGVTSYQITALALVVAIAVGLYLFIYKTNYGEIMRALANDENLALVSGINPTKVSVLIWFIAGVAGGLAGVFFGVTSFVQYIMGWDLILIVIMISIVGGIGNVRGALIAGFGAGFITVAVTLLTKPLYAQVVLLVLFIGALKARGLQRVRG
jgi:branched-subunit amino acid ABC-type transport system permease component